MGKIGCQTITWGKENQENMEKVLAEVSKAGFSGVEIGARHLNLGRGSYYRQLLNQNNLQLIGLHTGGDFLNKESVNNQLQNIEKIIDMIKYLDGEFLFISGLYKENKTETEYKEEARNYNEIGKMCNEQGITLCYHNHNWEIEHELTGFNIILENTEEELVSFVPDVGWIDRGGKVPAELLKQIYDRVKAIHFKDFTVDDDFIELGCGIVDFKSVYEVIKDKKDFWIIAEQDQTDQTPLASAKTNYQFINEIIER